MIKAFQFSFFKHFYSFSQTSSSYEKSIGLTVSNIITQKKSDPNFVYRHSKQVCQTISALFQDLPQNQYRNIHKLANLMSNLHLSGFSSWTALRQTSFIIEKVLNKVLAQRKQKIQQKNLNLLMGVITDLNYELETVSDRFFMNSQIFPVIDFCSINFETENLKSIEVLSSHSVVFNKFFQQRRGFQEEIIKLTEECVKDQRDKLRIHLISNIIKNGIYQNRWSPEFIQSLRTIFRIQQNLQMSLKGLLKAIQLNSARIKCIEQDKWSLSQPHQKDSNILTEIKIFNILKLMDYNIQTNQSLFNYEVDAKIGDKFIVEYHGIHHYRTNTKKPIETKKSNWKVQALKNRGYKVFIIPFYTWNKLQTAYQKKAWLIGNLEYYFFSQQIQQTQNITFKQAFEDQSEN